eukprot:TRINITY_DN18722_c0_g1_i1.p1 TRINITY_DN18722_c0_g1~~TRINITY_DN18722_c0_g1_i1.p1  ORF type:complete len:265 (-),score=29.29 TRINITY_DN18722_c0_g1_i1:463-1236(-)
MFGACCRFSKRVVTQRVMRLRAPYSAAASVSADASLVAGVDEAGRGAVLGPLVLAAVVMSNASERFLASLGAKDSKQIAPAKRALLYDIVTRHPGVEFETCHLTPSDIDTAKAAGVNLNELELRQSLALLTRLHAKIRGNDTFNISHQRTWATLYVDSVASDSAKYGQAFRDAWTCNVVCENQADALYTCVGVASIIAKVQRDQAIRALEDEFGSIGSGYPSDVKTIDFLDSWWKQHRTVPSIARTSFKTIENLTLR